MQLQNFGHVEELTYTLKLDIRSRAGHHFYSKNSGITYFNTDTDVNIVNHYIFKSNDTLHMISLVDALVFGPNQFYYSCLHTYI